MSAKLSMKEKQERMLNFIRQLNFSIAQQTRFSFTQQLSKFFVRWNANALSCRSIFFDEGLITENASKTNILQWTERGKKFTQKQLVDFIIEKIDGKQNHLANYTSDLMPETLGEPPEDDVEQQEEEPEEEEEVEVNEPKLKESKKTTKFASEATKAVRTLEILPPVVDLQSTQEILELDEVEWGVIRHALNKLIENGENEIYGQLAECIIQKIK
jgi:hypothetical protein